MTKRFQADFDEARGAIRVEGDGLIKIDLVNLLIIVADHLKRVTDPACGCSNCRKLHKAMAAIEALGQLAERMELN